MDGGQKGCRGLLKGVSMPEPVPQKGFFLIAEDDEDHFLITQEAMEIAGLPVQLFRVRDGVHLMDFLLKKGAYQGDGGPAKPHLLLLDLNMPKKDGREALTQIKAHPELKDIPVVVLTTSPSDDDLTFCEQLGVDRFIQKPDHFKEYVKAMKALVTFIPKKK